MTDRPTGAPPPPRLPPWHPRCPVCGLDLWDGIGRRWLPACDRCGWRPADRDPPRPPARP